MGQHVWEINVYLMCVLKKIKETGKKKVEATHSIHMVEGESVYRCVSLLLTRTPARLLTHPLAASLIVSVGA